MAARLAGFAEDRLRAADWQRPGYEQAITDGLFASLRQSLPEAELARLLEEGAKWNDNEAVARGLST
jgi:hypothetical protein